MSEFHRFRGRTLQGEEIGLERFAGKAVLIVPGLLGNNVKWNFTKFLIGRDGTPLRRFAPVTRPQKIEHAVREALGA